MRSCQLTARLAGLLVAFAACGGCAQTPTPPVPTTSAARPVYFVGLDGADWQQLEPLLAAGKLPNLARLRSEGASGTLTAFEPALSPLLWTSMATGLSPLEHGILDFARVDPASGRREPIGSPERRAPAIWNMASGAGKRVAVVGLWATHPAEAVTGLLITDRFVSSRGSAPPAGAVHPPERAPWAEEGARSVTVGPDELRTYLPWLSAAEAAAAATAPNPLAAPVSGLHRTLLETRLTHRLALDWLRSEPTELALVYYEGTDLVGHLFAPFAPPRQAHVPAADFERYGGVPERYFVEVDRLLGDYLELARTRGAVLFLASDHGFRWGADRPQTAASGETATAGLWHRPDGLWLLWGPGINPGRGADGGVEQVAATLLALLGLPPGKGLAGPPLGGLAPSPLASVDYRTGYRPQAPAPGRGDQELDQAAIDRLRALGYLGGSDPAPNAGLAAEATRTPASFNNEGLLRRARGERDAARTAFERALTLDPAYPSARLNLSELLFEDPATRERADALLLEAVRQGLALPDERLAARAQAWRQAAGVEPAQAWTARALTVRPGSALLRLWRGRLALERQDCAAARADFRAAVAGRSDDPLAWASLGTAEACLGELEAARRSLGRALELEPDQPEVRRFLDALDR